MIDEEPLTAKSPNAYEAALENRAKAKIGTGNELKITTSDQSTVNSLDSEDAATRFLTCFVCGQTLNVREYFAHEEQCVKVSSPSPPPPLPRCIPNTPKPRPKIIYPEKNFRVKIMPSFISF